MLAPMALPAQPLLTPAIFACRFGGEHSSKQRTDNLVLETAVLRKKPPTTQATGCSRFLRRTRRKYVLTDQIDQHIWEISHWAPLRSVSPRPPSARAWPSAWLRFLPLSDETVPPQEGSCQGGPCGTA